MSLSKIERKQLAELRDFNEITTELNAIVEVLPKVERSLNGELRFE